MLTLIGICRDSDLSEGRRFSAETIFDVEVDSFLPRSPHLFCHQVPAGGLLRPQHGATLQAGDRADVLGHILVRTVPGRQRL